MKHGVGAVGIETGGRVAPPVDSPIRETVFANGVQVLSEAIPGVRSTAVGVWVRQGSAHESGPEMGSSHLLEHMVFKGTERRTARDIAGALEGLGGSLDAYTTREYTSFQARVLDEHLPEALDVLADLVLQPLLRHSDLELERQVVLEEIAAVDDTPDDLVFELHNLGLWGEHGYAHSILGTRETVSKADAEALRALHSGRYTGRNLIVAAAGSVDHDDLVERTEAWFGSVPVGKPAPVVAPPAGARQGEEQVQRDCAQAHVVFGTDLVPHADPRRYALVLLSAAFGGGMSSRLFQRVREELGLAYTVFSFQSYYSVAGMGGVYVGTRPAWEEQAIEAIREEHRLLARDGLDDEELERTKRQVKGQIMLALESTGARLHRLAGFALRNDPYLHPEELLGRLDAVTADQVREAAAEFFDPERTYLLRLGPS